MTQYEFTECFTELCDAFTVQKPENKAKIYFEKLSRLSQTSFKKTCDYLTENTDKFPTIMKIIEVSRMFPDPETTKVFECKECLGGGMVSKWRHSFRCRCLNGERISKQIPLVPISHEDRKFWYGRLNKEWNETYGKDLVEGKTYQGEKEPEIITKAKEIFS